MPYMNAPNARVEYAIVRHEILKYFSEETLENLLPLFERYIKVKQSIVHHDKMKERSARARAVVSPLSAEVKENKVSDPESW